MKSSKQNHTYMYIMYIYIYIYCRRQIPSYYITFPCLLLNVSVSTSFNMFQLRQIWHFPPKNAIKTSVQEELLLLMELQAIFVGRHEAIGLEGPHHHGWKTIEISDVPFSSVSWWTIMKKIHYEKPLWIIKEPLWKKHIQFGDFPAPPCLITGGFFYGWRMLKWHYCSC